MTQNYTYVSPDEHNDGVRYACLAETGPEDRCLLPRGHVGEHSTPDVMTLADLLGEKRLAAMRKAETKRVSARRSG